MKSKVLSSYRQLLRAQQKTFASDTKELMRARDFTRSQFLKNRLITDPAQIQEMIKVASDASMIIRTQLVQAVKKTPQDNTFKLRLHEEIRLNDNDSIKTAGERFKEKKREIARRRKLGLPLLEESDTEGCGSSTAS